MQSWQSSTDGRSTPSGVFQVRRVLISVLMMTSPACAAAAESHAEIVGIVINRPKFL